MQPPDPAALQSPPAGGGRGEARLADVLTTDDFLRRPSRPAQHEAENRALVDLAAVMAEAPATVLQKLAEWALRLTGADSAGVSLLETREGQREFRWVAASGSYARLLGSWLPRDFSPCGVVLDRNAVQHMTHPARFYPYLADIRPPVAEVLLVPFYAGDEPVGTVWVVVHGDAKRFDAEDARVVGSLSKFAAAGVKALSQLQAQAALTADAERQARVFDTTLSAITDFAYIFDRDERFLYVNQPLLDLWGLKLEQAVGRNFFDLNYPDDLAAKLHRQIRQVIDTGKVLKDETAYTSPAGAAGDYEYIFSPVFAADGTVEVVAGSTRDITARKHLQLALDNERSKLAAVVEQAPAFICTLRGPEHVFELVNERFYEMVGERNLVGRPVRAALPEAQGQGFFELLDRVYRTGETSTGTGMPILLRRRDDGSLERRSVTIVYQALRETGGAVSGIFVHGVDVTDFVESREALRERERHFRLLSELGEQTGDLYDPEAVMATVARALGRHLNVSRCAYADVEADSDRFTIRHDYTDGCASTTGDYRLSLFGPRAAAEQRAGRTLVVRDVDAELGPAGGADTFNAIGVKAIVCCPLVRQGRLLAMMAVHQTTPRHWTPEEISLVEAVVERSWAYVERARAGRALAASEAAFRELADAMPQIVWAARPDGVLDYYNRRWFDYIDLPPGAGDDATWDRYIHPDDLPLAYETWSAAVASGKNYAIEFRVRGATGAYRWFLVRALPVRDAGGNTTRWFGTCTDIDDQKALQTQNEQLLASERAARAEAEGANRAKDKFLAVLSHELRTPLSPVVMTIPAIELDPDLPYKFRDDLAMVRRNIDLEVKLIDDLLDLSRVTSGKLRLQMQPVNVHGLLRHVIQSIAADTSGKYLNFRPGFGAANDRLTADPARLQQVFWNLLRNAVKFTPEGGEVAVRTWNDAGGALLVEVRDSGVGIAPEALPRVFDAFEQGEARTTRQFGGLGLGLAIAKAVVEMHGGAISAASAGRGSGATFTVRLATAAAVAPGAPRAAGPASARPAGQARSRVLLVEDHPDTARTLAKLLTNSGYDVKTAHSVSAALQLAAAAPFDVVVSDIGLPDATGYELMEQIRDRFGIRGIALSGYGMEDDMRRSRESGFADHVVKPVNVRELEAVIDRVVKG